MKGRTGGGGRPGEAEPQGGGGAASGLRTEVGPLPSPAPAPGVFGLAEEGAALITATHARGDLARRLCNSVVRRQLLTRRANFAPHFTDSGGRLASLLPPSR